MVLPFFISVGCIYLLRLSKKFNICIFVKFAYINVNHLKIY